MKNTRLLRQMMGESKLIVAPGAYDALSAKIIEQTGFSTVYVGGHASIASQLAKPDLRILTRDEFLASAVKITSAVDVPVIADGEDGYGDLLQVQRTVAEYEKAGICAMHIEDHEFGIHFGYGQCIPVDKMAKKIKLACDARTDSDFLIIGRTDALCMGKPLAEAIDRVKAYADAGADAVFVECLTLKQMEKTSQALSVPVMGDYYGLVRNKKDVPSMSQVETTGLRLLILPIEILLSVYATVRTLVQELKDTGSLTKYLDGIADVNDLDEFLGTREMIKLAKRHS